jgi:predicted ATPase
MARFQIDQKIPAHYFLARILWLRGYFEQARRLVDLNVEEGINVKHALTFCSVLGQGACPIALFTGDLQGARRFAARLVEHARHYQLALWHDWARCYEGLVIAREGDLRGGIERMQSVLEQIGDVRLLPRYMILLGELSACLGEAGDVAAGLETITALIARCDESDERWYLPEALRVKSELVLRRGEANATGKAEALLEYAISLAQQQHARAWELRAATSFARLVRDHGRGREARAQLQTLVSAFTEGFDTPDFQSARNLLAS